jgi:hypothetical protein
MRRHLAILLVLGCSTPVVAAPPGVRVYPSPNDDKVTEGETIVTGDPGDIYATVLDYARWTEIFPDVAKVEITQKNGVDARVTLIGPDGHRDNLHFHNQPAARMVWFEDTGNGGHAEVWAEIMFVPGAEPNTTRVHTRLYADVKGVASLVVSDGTVRQQREQKITKDLVHIRGYFQRTASR